MRFLALALLTVGAAGPVATPLAAQRPAPRAADVRALDAYVTQAVRDWQVPGLAIAVVHDDSVVFARGYGVRTLGTADSVTVHTLFANASTTKAFTAVGVALLVDEGKLDWDAPVTRYLPEFQLRDPYVTREITLRDLLSHKVGFGDPEYLWYGVGDDYGTILRRLRFVEPESSFRSRYAYNNVTYATAGVIAGRVYGRGWDALVRERILVPLGMRETVTEGSELKGRADVATPHDLVDDTLRAIPDVGRLADPIAPAGAMYSNVLDMARWIRFLLDDGRVGDSALVKPETLAELFRPQTIIPTASFYPTARRTQPHFTAYGMGWFLQDYRGALAAFHTGSIDGTVAIVGLLPAEKLGVVVFANRDHAELRHALMLRVFDLYLGAPRRDWSGELKVMYDSIDGAAAARRAARVAARVPDTHPSLALERYAGSYADSTRGTVVVTVEGDHLVFTRSPFLTADLAHWNFDSFALHWRNPWLGQMLVTFRLAADGTVEGMEWEGAELRRMSNVQ
jgi:CubicO group peptidase (beta-lactamase class C family)